MVLQKQRELSRLYIVGLKICVSSTKNIIKSRHKSGAPSGIVFRKRLELRNDHIRVSQQLFGFEDNIPVAIIVNPLQTF